MIYEYWVDKGYIKKNHKNFTWVLVLLVSSFLSNVWKSLFNWSHVEMLKSFTHFYIFGNKKETVLSRTFPCPGTHKQKTNAGGVLAQVNVLYQALTFLITKGKDCYRTSLPKFCIICFFAFFVYGPRKIQVL